MPFESAKQARLMRAVAHGWHKPGGGGPTPQVASKFVSEDKAHPSGYAGGGSVKGYQGKVAAYAQGGAVLGRTRDFMKEPDRFRKGYQDNPPVVKTDDNYGDKSSEPKGKDKSLKAVKPRS